MTAWDIRPGEVAQRTGASTNVQFEYERARRSIVDEVSFA